MFYSHEILTDRKYGVATVWLVATLGAKSNTKRVTRKTIEKVDIKKVCKTIIKPDVPLALRLQSNLLYGVSRVHQQQWEYLLSDTQAAQNVMRTLLRTVRNEQLDPNAGKAQRDQLVLVDDPAFAIDSALPALDLDFWDLNDAHNADSQRSTQSMLSMRSRSRSVISLHPPSVLGFNISSSNGGSVYQLPNDPFAGPSIHKPFNSTFNNDEDMLVMDDDLFDFDADGNMRDIPPEELKARRAASLAPRSRLGSDSAASGRVRQEHEDARAGKILDRDIDFNMQFLDDNFELPLLPDADPFPTANGAFMTGGLGPGDIPLHFDGDDRVFPVPEPTSSGSAEAQQKKKRKRPVKKVKFMKMDQVIQFKNADLIIWDKGYINNMDRNLQVQKQQIAVKQSKKTAFYVVYGAGLNGVGTGIGSEHFEHPLAMFSGAALLAKITGSLPQGPVKRNRGTKRINASSEDEQSTPNKRPLLEDEVARGFAEDNLMLMNEDIEQSMEIGRDAPSALADYPSSAMPWNKSASLLSQQQIQSSRPGSQIGRRLTSASPLVGRGSAFPVDLIGEQDEMVMYGRSESLQPPSQHDLAYGGDASSSHAAGGSGRSQEFEIFGAAAGVDTQTAADSQWVRSILDHESNNFLDYVKNNLDDRFGEEDEDDVIDELSDGFDLDIAAGSRYKNKGKGKAVEQERKVSFEQLFAPEQNSYIVAAQAFYHVLTLATKSKVCVHQDDGVGEADFEPFGEIWIGVI